MFILKMKLKRVFAIILILILCYVWFSPRQFSYKETVTIPRAQPNEIWEYVADFSNMIKLNPTIIDFAILSESGNYEHWKYTAEYKEHLSHWPYLTNIGTAHVSVHSNWRKNIYVINSTHTTCFVPKLFCLNSYGEFKFTLVNNMNVGAPPDTLCEETVLYQCPPILYFYCKREVVYQRKAIMDNLQQQFTDSRLKS